MRVDNSQFNRFSYMMQEFGRHHNISVRCDRVNTDNNQRCIVKFITDYSRLDGPTYEVNFFDVGSLTEAAAPIMADVMVKFNLVTSGCCVEIRDVIFNPPATIVFWADGTKTVVKTQEDDEFDPEKGLAMAISKKALGNQGNYYNHFKKWTEKYEEKQPSMPATLDELENYFANLAATFRDAFGIKD